MFLSLLEYKTIQGLELNVLTFEDIKRTMASSSLKQEILEPLLKAQSLVFKFSVASCYRNQDKLWPDGQLGSYADFTFTYCCQFCLSVVWLSCVVIVCSMAHQCLLFLPVQFRHSVSVQGILLLPVQFPSSNAF